MNTQQKHDHVRITTLLVFVLMLGTLAGCQSVNMKTAEDNMHAGKYQQAIPLLTKEIDANPVNANAHFLLGKCYLAIDYTTDAEKCFDRAKRLDAGLSRDADKEIVLCEIKNEKLDLARQNNDKADGQIQTLGQYLDMFHEACGRFPTTKECLQALVSQPANVKGWEQYRDRISSLADMYSTICDGVVTLDPWGHPYNYRCPGLHNTDGYDLWSAGPDGKSGTADDIDNWTSKKK